MNILLTGGMGFIGSHTAVVLIEAGHDVVLFDNLSNADRSVLDRIETITGRRPVFIEGDIRDAAAMEKALDGVDAVIHFAGLKAVGESVSKPVEYYDNNVNGTLVLLAAMRRKGVNRIIFSSSSTVYGTPETLPLTEDCPTGEPTNPYGRSKLHIEQILADVCRAYPESAPSACATSTRSAPIPRASSARIPTAFRTTCCPTSPAWLTARCPACASSDTTTRRPTARACATSST